MSILAQNIKTLRKELGCTQSVMGDILKVGFRTYVRYEAGERDAPVAILVKLARLGRISLERLLTTEIARNDIVAAQALAKDQTVPEVSSVNFDSGQISLRKPTRKELLTLDDAERKMLTLFRKMSEDKQDEVLKGFGKPTGRRLEKPVKAKVKKKPGRKPGRKALKRVVPKKAKKRGRPGRKKMDRKVLKEKIDKLKMITQSIQKITVR